MANAMGTAALYKPSRGTCRDCGKPVEGRSLYCQRDRDRRRALTFLEQADRILNAPDRIVAFVAARDHVRSAIEELTR